ncbi:YybH family protein [Winogradskyella flava]|uniref:Nuclear transport factor 2 family protein n=1 Tax=Winogradskyella flava TaxID=1884876 RepID=A0A842IS31_9FLAO|nr:nuclear transport factor 2 family protein [Winogradskyella flava]MBC2843688.1 nuclear transport factor 2 family protein [Winogradskyella flava]
MKKYLLLIAFFLVFTSISIYAQEASIKYESNGKTTTLRSSNPFAKFFGEWTLKDDDWRQNWGGETEYIKIPKHHTVSAGINTKNTLISIIDGPEPNGHIFWSYNPNTKEVYHLSSFGDIRAGHGKGTIDDNGNLRLKLSFEGEPKGTYRVYTYTWLTNDEYELKSEQFDKNDKPTGLFYAGNFIRVKVPGDDIKREVLKHGEIIREAFSKADIETIRSLHHPEVIKALGYNDIKNGREAVVSSLRDTLSNYNLEFIENEIENILVEGNIAIEQTKFSIKGTPKQGGESFIFSGRTIVTYIKYADSPTGWATIREIIQPSN